MLYSHKNQKGVVYYRRSYETEKPAVSRQTNGAGCKDKQVSRGCNRKCVKVSRGCNRKRVKVSSGAIESA